MHILNALVVSMAAVGISFNGHTRKRPARLLGWGLTLRLFQCFAPTSSIPKVCFKTKLTDFIATPSRNWPTSQRRKAWWWLSVAMCPSSWGHYSHCAFCDWCPWLRARSERCLRGQATRRRSGSLAVRLVCLIRLWGIKEMIYTNVYYEFNILKVKKNIAICPNFPFLF